MNEQPVQHKTVAEMLQVVGGRVRAFRVNQDVSQEEAARRAGVSLRALRQLEREGHSKLETLVRVLRALDAPTPLNFLAPEPQVSPMALVRSPAGRKRASKRPI